MGVCNKFLLGSLGVVALSVFIAYITAPTFPEKASNHGLKCAFGLTIKFIVFTSDIGGMMGFSKVGIMRSMLDYISSVNHKDDAIEEITTTIEGVEVLIMKPATSRDDELRPGILHYHGGGWVLLTPAAYTRVIREMVRQTQAVVISVHYRRAPEHVFPAAIEDCLKVTRYVLKNAAEYGVDKNRIGIKGDSAGGNLAMAAAVALAQEDDKDLPGLRFMSMDYPVLQAFDFSVPSYVQYGNGPGVLNHQITMEVLLLYAFGNLEYLDVFANNVHLSKKVRESKYAERVSTKYLPKRYRDISVKKSDDIMPKVVNVSPKILEKIEKIVLDPMYAPLMAPDEVLAKLPKTYIMNAEFDIVRDDGFIAAERLRSVGVEVEHSYLPAEEHPFLNLVDLDTNIRKEYINFARFFNSTVGA